jgi:hypothetical protein
MPAFYRAQIADLADIAQRLQLTALGLTREESEAEESGGAPSRDRVRQMESEIWRLVQFARTLGYLVSPPTAGEQYIDLAVLLDELLTGMSAEGGTQPRFLHDGQERVHVRSDKGLLVRALDAVLQVARACATGGDTLLATTSVRSTPAVRGGRAAVIEVLFPAGPLADLRPQQILEPYALRRRLATIGPNALAAAEGILRGQGGALELDAPEADRLRWRVLLPLQEVGRGEGDRPPGFPGGTPAGAPSLPRTPDRPADRPQDRENGPAAPRPPSDSPAGPFD